VCGASPIYFAKLTSTQTNTQTNTPSAAGRRKEDPLESSSSSSG
jgi:hypothetical protein